VYYIIEWMLVGSIPHVDMTAPVYGYQYFDNVVNVCKIIAIANFHGLKRYLFIY